MTIRRETTQFGFNFGAAVVTRLHANEEKEWVLIGVNTPKAALQVYVTKTGKIRVWKDGKELK